MEIALSIEDTGATREASVGDVVVIALAEQPTSGYRWGVEELTPELTLSGDEFVPDSDHQLGARGQRVFRFEARAPGAGRVTLRRWRKWEGEASIVERFGATINIES
jgi:inhibitor of cysteine peptidase